MQKATPDDPKGLIFEAFRIDGITKAECRSIFLDWALSLGVERETHGADPKHPMAEVLSEGLHVIPTPRRRGGWRSRQRD